jgi:hypothetical protein
VNRHHLPITTTNLVTAAATLVVVGVAMASVILLSGTGRSFSEMEYQVWTTFLGEAFGRGDALAPFTLTAIHRERLEADVEEFLASKGTDPALAEPLREALGDLLERNRESRSIEPRFPARSKIRILTVAGWERLTAQGMWSRSELRQTCPDVDRIWQVSRVGFGRRGLYALVAVSSSMGPLAGHGGVVLYRWTGDGWAYVAEFAGWMS